MTLTRLPAAAGAAVLAVLLLATGCASSESPAEAADDRLRVVTTVAPLTSLAASIGGDRVRITGVVPEGTNSHTFDPPPKAAEVMEDADVVLVNGLKLEEPTFDLAEDNAPE